PVAMSIAMPSSAAGVPPSASGNQARVYGRSWEVAARTRNRGGVGWMTGIKGPPMVAGRPGQHPRKKTLIPGDAAESREAQRQPPVESSDQVGAGSTVAAGCPRWDAALLQA